MQLTPIPKSNKSSHSSEQSHHILDNAILHLQPYLDKSQQQLLSQIKME